MDGWKILGGVLGVFTAFTSVTTAIVSLNVRITSLEKDVKINEQRINEYQSNLKQQPNLYYGTNQQCPPNSR